MPVQSNTLAPTPPPQYIYKIIPAAPPQPLPAALPLSDLDSSDGFIHLSVAAQVSGTCARFFTAATQIWLLRIALKDVERDIKWEDSKSGVFPHLYGQQLGALNVESVMTFQRSSDEGWEDVFKRAEFA